MYITGMTAAEARAAGQSVPEQVSDCAVFEPLLPLEVKDIKVLGTLVKVTCSAHGQWKWAEALFSVNLM